MSAESQNVSRRFRFEVTETWEFPIDEAKLREYVGEDGLDVLNVELLARGIEQYVIDGETTPQALADMLNSNPSHVLADPDFRVEIEQRCPKHPVWFSLTRTLRPPNENPCFMCREEERHAQDD